MAYGIISADKGPLTCYIWSRLYLSLGHKIWQCEMLYTQWSLNSVQ